MTTYREGSSLRLRDRLLAVFLLCTPILLGSTACTRDDVASAISTIVVELEATLVPWGATTVANAQTAYATAKAPVSPTAPSIEGKQTLPSSETPSRTPLPTETAAPTATPIPSATATTIPSATPSPTSMPTATPTDTATPTETPTATITPTPSPTPFPVRLEVPGGEMLLVNAGTFFMGASAASLQSECSVFRDGCQTSWFSASEPVHVVLLAPYYVDSHEVSNDAYTVFLNETENPCGAQLCLDIGESELVFGQGVYRSPEDRGDHPVTGVTWYGAAAFCEWRGARLPSEAEWERAAAWDEATGAALRYPWGDDFDGEVVNFCDSSCDEPQALTDFSDGYPETAPVTELAAGRSPVGAYHMAGNVWEWVSDWFDPDYYTQSTESNPLGPDSGVEKVVRGGSWFDTGNFMASAIRFPTAPDNADRTIGFRCAADLPSIGGSP